MFLAALERVGNINLMMSKFKNHGMVFLLASSIAGWMLLKSCANIITANFAGEGGGENRSYDASQCLDPSWTAHVGGNDLAYVGA